jgi:hypothetical protein
VTLDARALARRSCPERVGGCLWRMLT